MPKNYYCYVTKSTTNNPKFEYLTKELYVELKSGLKELKKEAHRFKENQIPIDELFNVEDFKSKYYIFFFKVLISYFWSLLPTKKIDKWFKNKILNLGLEFQKPLQFLKVSFNKLQKKVNSDTNA